MATYTIKKLSEIRAALGMGYTIVKSLQHGTDGVHYLVNQEGKKVARLQGQVWRITKDMKAQNTGLEIYYS